MIVENQEGQKETEEEEDKDEYIDLFRLLDKIGPPPVSEKRKELEAKIVDLQKVATKMIEDAISVYTKAGVPRVDGLTQLLKDNPEQGKMLREGWMTMNNEIQLLKTELAQTR